LPDNNTSGGSNDNNTSGSDNNNTGTSFNPLIPFSGNSTENGIDRQEQTLPDTGSENTTGTGDHPTIDANFSDTGTHNHPKLHHSSKHKDTTGDDEIVTPPDGGSNNGGGGGSSD